MKPYNAPFYTKEELESKDEKDLHFPFSDDDATYIGSSHQYELTDKYFMERGINLNTEIEGNDPEKVKHFLFDLRIKVYAFIYTHNCMTNRKLLNYMIAKRGINGFTKYEYRQAFLEAMFLEGCYLINNGDITNVTGVDLDTMQNMSADVIRNQDRDFKKDVIGLLTQLGLNYRGKYRFIPQGEDW